MTKTFTQTDVLRFFYNEVTEKERQEIQIALLWNNQLAEYHQELVELEGNLNKVKKEPSARAIENILNYSRSLSLQSLS